MESSVGERLSLASQRRNTGRFSHSFHCRGVYETGPLALALKTALTLVRVGEPKASSRMAMLTKRVTMQKMRRLIGVK